MQERLRPPFTYHLNAGKDGGGALLGALEQRRGSYAGHRHYFTQPFAPQSIRIPPQIPIYSDDLNRSGFLERHRRRQQPFNNTARRSRSSINHLRRSDRDGGLDQLTVDAEIYGGTYHEQIPARAGNRQNQPKYGRR